MLVPPVITNATTATIRSGKSSGSVSGGLKDRPDVNDPRDSHVGHKRIDVPKQGVVTSGAGALKIAEIRFNCIALVKAILPSGAAAVTSETLMDFGAQN